jgi:hypothetical protein
VRVLVVQLERELVILEYLIAEGNPSTDKSKHFWG